MSSCEGNPIAILIALADRLRNLFDQAAADAGLTAGQAHLLMRLESPTRMGDLAHQQTCDPSSVTAMVRRLERDGFVERTVDPTDARARIVRLTAKGRRVRNHFVDSVGDGSGALDTLSPVERAALAGLFSPTSVR